MSTPSWVPDLFASIDGMDPDRFASFVADDATFVYGSNPPVAGKDAIKDFVKLFFSMFKQLEHTLIGTWTHPDTVFVQGEVTYHNHDGSVKTLPFFNCFKMRGDKIGEYLIYIDPTPLSG